MGLQFSIRISRRGTTGINRWSKEKDGRWGDREGEGEKDKRIWKREADVKL